MVKRSLLTSPEGEEAFPYGCEQEVCMRAKGSRREQQHAGSEPSTEATAPAVKKQQKQKTRRSGWLGTAGTEPWVRGGDTTTTRGCAAKSAELTQGMLPCNPAHTLSTCEQGCALIAVFPPGGSRLPRPPPAGNTAGRCSQCPALRDWSEGEPPLTTPPLPQSAVVWFMPCCFPCGAIGEDGDEASVCAARALGGGGAVSAGEAAMQSGAWIHVP